MSGRIGPVPCEPTELNISGSSSDRSGARIGGPAEKYSAPSKTNCRGSTCSGHLQQLAWFRYIYCTPRSLSHEVRLAGTGIYCDEMMTSVLIAIACRSIWRNFEFWISLAVCSALHLVVVHACTQTIPNLSRGARRGAAVLGLSLFFAVYKFASLLRRNFLRGRSAWEDSRYGDAIGQLLINPVAVEKLTFRPERSKFWG